MYTETLSPTFTGMTFAQASELCFVKLKLLLLALEVSSEQWAPPVKLVFDWPIMWPRCGLMTGVTPRSPSTPGAPRYPQTPWASSSPSLPRRSRGESQSHTSVTCGIRDHDDIRSFFKNTVCFIHSLFQLITCVTGRGIIARLVTKTWRTKHRSENANARIVSKQEFSKISL